MSARWCILGASEARELIGAWQNFGRGGGFAGNVRSNVAPAYRPQQYQPPA